MPRIDFNEIDRTEKYPPLPNGKYRCKIAEVEESETRSGHEMWKLRLEVVEGKYMGRIIFQNLVFKGRGYERVMVFCDALGLDVSRKIDLTPDLIIGRSLFVEVCVVQYTDPQGRKRSGNEVAFDGFSRTERCEELKGGRMEENDDLPF